jgi:hypothetical protein
MTTYLFEKLFLQKTDEQGLLHHFGFEQAQSHARGRVQGILQNVNQVTDGVQMTRCFVEGF